MCDELLRAAPVMLARNFAMNMNMSSVQSPMPSKLSLNFCSSRFSPMEINDILCYIFLNLSPLELLSAITLVSSSWNKLILNNKLLWLYNCDVLWKGKLFILQQAMHCKASKPVDAFKISWLDRERNVITLAELTSIKWRFRFKDLSFHSLLIDRDSDTDDDMEPIAFAQFHEDGSLIHENVDFRSMLFRWKFVAETKFNPFGLQRSPRFASLSDFDIDAKNSTNSNCQTCFGYEPFANAKTDEREHEEDEDEDEDQDVAMLSPRGERCALTQSRWIKVNNFSTLCVFRDDNWGWILQNEQVIMTSY